MKYQLDLINGQSVEIEDDRPISELRDAIAKQDWCWSGSPDEDWIRCSAVVRIRVIKERTPEENQRIIEQIVG